jgi:hypothetical protein
MMPLRKWARVIALCFLIMALPGCAADTPTVAPPQERPLTEDEANQFAVTRFRNYEAKGVKFSAVLPSAAGQVSLTGYLNFRASVGYALVRPVTASQTEVGLVQWNVDTRILWSGEYSGSTPQPQLPPIPGKAGGISPATSSVDAALAILLALGSDRPDNPQLLRQSDARWVRADAIKETPVVVVRGPSAEPGGSSRTLYWINEQGQLLRLELQLPSGNALIDFSPDEYINFAIAKELQAKAGS